jgi:short-subunit dehydrogenase
MELNYYRNKTVLITGGSSGIGESFAKNLSLLGAHVIISARREDELLRVQSQLAFPANSNVCVMDMTNEDQIDLVCNQILSQHKIDIVILNAGISQRSIVLKTSFKVEERIMQTNFFGLTRVAKHLLPQMIERGKGHFVVMSSVTGKIGVPGRSSYAASKHALHGYFDSLRAEVSDLGLFVSIICPGYVFTSISENALMADGSPQNKIDKNSKTGMQVDDFVKKALKGIAKKKQEMLIGGKETLGVTIKRFFPGLLNNIVKKVKEE